MKYFVIILSLTILVAFAIYTNIGKHTNMPANNNAAPQVTEAPTQSVSVVAQNLDTPWSLVFLPDKSMLVTLREGKVVRIDKDGNRKEVATIEKVKEFGEGGLLGITLHPEFSKNNFVYLYYTYTSDGDNTLNRVVRMTYDGQDLSDEKVIVDAIAGAVFHDGGRIKFGPDGFLYITTGDANQPSRAQDKNSLSGKILRVDDNGKKAPGNPFDNLVYSLGHRNPQGLVWDKNGNLWETEHGPSGIWPNCCQDEINLIKKGGNYGWPQSVGDKVLPSIVAPVLHSGRDVWAPSGTAIIGYSLFFAGLKGSALYEYNINEKTLVEHFKNEFGRIRDAVVGPDGMIYILTNNTDGRGLPKSGDDKIIRINPEML